MASTDLPSTYRAAVRQSGGATATTSVVNIDTPNVGPGQILVKITWTGVCGSDKSLLRDEWSVFGVGMKPETNGIAGHEGAGVVVAVGESASGRWSVGDRAGIKWIASVCGECEFCLNGVDEVHCVKQLNSGFSSPGTFQEYCLTDARYASKLPEGVLDEEAGPIMCGGVTAYGACKRSDVKAGQWLVILGAGGGIGHFAIQYAKAMGIRVIAVDGGDDKRDLCFKLGAEKFIDFKTSSNISAEIASITQYGAHGVIVCAATKAAYETAPTYLRPAGTLVTIGLPKDASILAGAPPIMVALKRLKIVGSVVGSLKEVEEALDFTARGLVKPMLSKGKLEDVDEWIAKLDAGSVVGRAVLQVSS
ncbi:unnamed protein product [Clonostachys rosea f. rosea IK726]|uniref:alcohol dehydrogenase n=2 Tax=Bionectria ochroleuca TaxID=29856 RepID=A0A0B7KAN5_BIOOC|nr:unnamed protein product [Clonostachys rosea f. rosea IK726]